MDISIIKSFFLTHSTLISLAVMAIKNNCDTSFYMFYNSMLLIVQLSAIAMDKSADIALVGSLFNGFCIVFDILLLASYNYLNLTTTRIIILNLVLRAV